MALFPAMISAPVSARDGPQLTARPAAVPFTLRPGVTRLNARSYAYVPVQLAAPAPLIVLLHGAGGSAPMFLQRFIGEADQRGAILLALQSERSTWTLRPDEDAAANYGADPVNLDAALAQLFAVAPVDAERVVLGGFSDGASLGLSLGLANPRLFRGILALSPGFVLMPAGVDRRQRVFIAHGRRDRVLPFTNTRYTILSRLEREGLRPRSHWFVGGHTIDEAALRQGLDYLLAPRARVEVRSRPR